VDDTLVLVYGAEPPGRMGDEFAEHLEAIAEQGRSALSHAVTTAKAAGVTTIPTGMAGACVSDQSTATGDELYDMSGNVKEWVLSTTATAGPYEMRGGAYNVASFTVGGVTSAPGLQCDASVPAPAAPTDVRLPSVGFRCCMTGQLPP